MRRRRARLPRAVLSCAWPVRSRSDRRRRLVVQFLPASLRALFAPVCRRAPSASEGRPAVQPTSLAIESLCSVLLDEGEGRLRSHTMHTRVMYTLNILNSIIALAFFFGYAV